MQTQRDRYPKSCAACDLGARRSVVSSASQPGADGLREGG